MLRVDLERAAVPDPEKRQARAADIVTGLFQNKDPMTGWVHWPAEIDDELVQRICRTAEQLKAKCSLFLVAGIGGSYLGARAVIDALGNHPDWPEVVFVGNSLCGPYHQSVLRMMKNRDTCLCCISKSGGSLEPTVAYHVVKREMQKKYSPEELQQRILIVTGPQQSPLRREAEENGYEIFEIPTEIGGRFSVLTSVGLLPIAAAGIDIRALLKGAASLCDESYWKTEGFRYAAARYSLMEAKSIEAFEMFSPSLRYFGEWIKQLTGESEGKDGRGLFPVSLQLSTDLHSLGQYLQEGRPIIFETVLDVEEWEEDVDIPVYEGGRASGMTMNQVNRLVCESMIRAHSKEGTPVIVIRIPQLDEEHLGALIYFFEMSVAITGRLMGVNPFDQPGVEKYKRELNALLQAEREASDTN